MPSGGGGSMRPPSAVSVAGSRCIVGKGVVAGSSVRPVPPSTPAVLASTLLRRRLERLHRIERQGERALRPIHDVALDVDITGLGDRKRNRRRRPATAAASIVDLALVDRQIGRRKAGGAGDGPAEVPVLDRTLLHGLPPGWRSWRRAGRWRRSLWRGRFVFLRLVAIFHCSGKPCLQPLQKMRLGDGVGRRSLHAVVIGGGRTSPAGRPAGHRQDRRCRSCSSC
jgi:hypothetical protein